MKIRDIIEGKSENRELWDRIKSKGVVPSIDRERYTDMSGEGLEGPFRMKNGQVLYYDPKEGKYYNRDTDMYVDYDDYRAMNEEDAYDKDVKPSDKPHDKEAAAERAKAAALAAAKKAKEQGVAEASGDQVKKVFKKNGEPVGEVGIDPEASPGNGQWYMKCYAYNIDNSGYDSYEEAVEELKYCLKQGVAEGDKRPDYVVKASDKPKKVKPSMGGSSAHPYQGKLVGEAEVGNTEYQWAHGKKPSGQGSWFFVAHRGGINFRKDVENEDYVQLHGMSFGDAKKAAIKWAKSKGHTSLFVAT
jgi:hypothetical protein